MGHPGSMGHPFPSVPEGALLSGPLDLSTLDYPTLTSGVHRGPGLLRVLCGSPSLLLGRASGTWALRPGFKFQITLPISVNHWTSQSLSLFLYKTGIMLLLPKSCSEP